MVGTVKDVVAAILINNDKVLIAQRANNDPLAGYWEFPGGKIEEGESPEDSLIREMQEEFCIDIEVGEFFGSSLFPYDQGTIRLLTYMCRSTSGEIRSTVHYDYAWVAINEVDQYTFAHAHRPLVERLRRGCRTRTICFRSINLRASSPVNTGFSLISAAIINNVKIYMKPRSYRKRIDLMGIRETRGRFSRFLSLCFINHF